MAKVEEEPFTLVTADTSPSLFPDYKQLTSAHIADPDVQLTSALRSKYPELNLTVVPVSNAPILDFAAAGHATAELDTETDSILRWRGFVPASHRGGQGALGDNTFFAKYHYRYGTEDFIVYNVGYGTSAVQYILKEPGSGETQLSHCAATDTLVKATVLALAGNEDEYVYVYDRYWTRSKQLWEQVQHSTWHNVILSAKTKHALQSVSQNFFDSKDVYTRFGVPWKRGLIFHGPAGNGKTISIKALMRTLYKRQDPIPTLYVKSAPNTYDIRNVFQLARKMAPCALILEDIETIVTANTRSYFFNEVDGLESNDGILMVASTNYLDRLDPGLSNRPSRFDRKYLFPLPNKHERTLYARFWQRKVHKSDAKIPFPEEMCDAIADITADFSFAYMQEAFVAALLTIAREGAEDEAGFEGCEDLDDLTQRLTMGNTVGTSEDPHDDLNGYKLWRVIKAQIHNLRDQIGGDAGDQLDTSGMLCDAADTTYTSRAIQS